MTSKLRQNQMSLSNSCSSVKGVTKKNLSGASITLFLHSGGFSQLGTESMNVRKQISESKNMGYFFVA